MCIRDRWGVRVSFGGTSLRSTLKVNNSNSSNLHVFYAQVISMTSKDESLYLAPSNSVDYELSSYYTNKRVDITNSYDYTVVQHYFKRDRLSSWRDKQLHGDMEEEAMVEVQMVKEEADTTTTTKTKKKN